MPRAGLSRLSAWWVAVGIHASFSRPGTPQDNGAHERMHGDMRFELEDHACASRAEQQRACDAWVEAFNHVRPHEALAMKTPGEVYVRSSRPYRGVRAYRYKPTCEVRIVGSHGTIR